MSGTPMQDAAYLRDRQDAMANARRTGSPENDGYAIAAETRKTAAEWALDVEAEVRRRQDEATDRLRAQARAEADVLFMGMEEASAGRALDEMRERNEAIAEALYHGAKEMLDNCVNPYGLSGVTHRRRFLHVMDAIREYDRMEEEPDFKDETEGILGVAGGVRGRNRDAMIRLRQAPCGGQDAEAGGTMRRRRGPSRMDESKSWPSADYDAGLFIDQSQPVEAADTTDGEGEPQEVFGVAVQDGVPTLVETGVGKNDPWDQGPLYDRGKLGQRTGLTAQGDATPESGPPYAYEGPRFETRGHRMPVRVWDYRDRKELAAAMNLRAREAREVADILNAAQVEGGDAKADEGKEILHLAVEAGGIDLFRNWWCVAELAASGASVQTSKPSREDEARAIGQREIPAVADADEGPADWTVVHGGSGQVLAEDEPWGAAKALLETTVGPLFAFRAALDGEIVLRRAEGGVWMVYDNRVGVHPNQRTRYADKNLRATRDVYLDLAMDAAGMRDASNDYDPVELRHEFDSDDEGEVERALASAPDEPTGGQEFPGEEDMPEEAASDPDELYAADYLDLRLDDPEERLVALVVGHRHGSGKRWSERMAKGATDHALMEALNFEIEAETGGRYKYEGALGDAVGSVVGGNGALIVVKAPGAERGRRLVGWEDILPVVRRIFSVAVPRGAETRPAGDDMDDLCLEHFADKVDGVCPRCAAEAQ